MAQRFICSFRDAGQMFPPRARMALYKQGWPRVPLQLVQKARLDLQGQPLLNHSRDKRQTAQSRTDEWLVALLLLVTAAVRGAVFAAETKGAVPASGPMRGIALLGTSSASWRIESSGNVVPMQQQRRRLAKRVQAQEVVPSTASAHRCQPSCGASWLNRKPTSRRMFSRYAL